MDLAVELPAGGVGASSSSASRCRYLALTKIGGGSFGDTLAAVNECDPNDWVALKVEALYRANDLERTRVGPSMVRFEQRVCRELARGPCPGGGGGAQSWHGCPCPAVRGCVSLHGEQDVLVMELLGPNLRDYADRLGCWPLPQDLVLVLGAALLERLSQLHACGFVHRDLKPENFLLRLEPTPDEGPVPCLLLVDYAIAMRFCMPGGTRHVQMRTDASQVEGTHRYMAINAQRGMTQSRQSDLESLAYVLIYLALGQLPWAGQDTGKMLEQKEATTAAELCRSLRPEFARLLERCKELGFDEAPDYEALQRLLLRGVTGPVDFQAARVRQAFRLELQEAYFHREDARCRNAAYAPAAGHPTQAPRAALQSVVPIFARHVGREQVGSYTELVAGEPALAAHLDDRSGFFFESYAEPVPGTVHAVVGACHFFGFLRREYLSAAHAEAGLPSAGAEQLLVFSLGKRDWVVRAVTLRDYDPSLGRPYKEWNLRCAFWARVVVVQ